jgi:hypothetical protein
VQEWKIISPFNLRCKKQATRQHDVKFAIQLYKVKERKYLLDVKKLEGDTLVLFDVCAKFLNELKL